MLVGDEVRKKIEEGTEDTAPSLKLDIPDNELLPTINKLLAESADLQEKMDKFGESNENYWRGAQLEQEKIRRGSAKIVDNRLWLSLETIIPIATSRTPEPTVRLKDPALREKIKQICMNAWEVPTDDDSAEDMQSLTETVVRHWGLYRVGVLKYAYDPDIDDVRTTYVIPKKIRFDKLGKTVNDCRFVAEYCEDTVEGLCAKWPNKKAEILAQAGRIKQDSSKLTYIEFWTNEYVVYKFMEVILEKKKNPNFDYGDMGGKNEDQTAEPTLEEASPEPIVKKGKYNLFKNPRKPFLLLSVFNLGRTVYDDTSLFEQGKTIQDSINKVKRNITDNAADNGVLIGSGDHIDKKVLEAYTGAPDEKMWVKSGDAQEALTRLPPKQMAPYIMEDLKDNKSEIDNLFGTHDTTRGEKSSQKTATETQALRQGDMGRIDIISRSLDRLAQDWYTAYLHMKFVFCTKPTEVNSNDEEGTSIIFDRDEYLNPETGELYKIIIKVKPGSSMSIDKDARRQEAMTLMQGEMIDPITFFERMDYPNPQQMAKSLFLWKTNPVALFPDLLQAQQQQQAAQAQQQMHVASNSPIPEGTPLNLPNQGSAPPPAAPIPSI